MQFSTYNEIRKCMMNFLLGLGTASPTQISCTRGVGVVYDFVKRTTIPEFESELYLRANIFSASDQLDMLQDNRLEEDHPIRVTLPSMYAVKLY